MDTHDVLTVSQVAERSGFAPSALRYYEKEGLVRASRTPGGQRRYERSVLRRLAFIRAAGNVGLSLEEIKSILGVWSHGVQPCGEVSRMLDEKLQALDRLIRELTDFRDALAAYKSRVDAAGVNEDTPCKHIAGVSEGLWTATLPESAPLTAPR